MDMDAAQMMGSDNAYSRSAQLQRTLAEKQCSAARGVAAGPFSELLLLLLPGLPAGTLQTHHRL